MAAGLEEAWMPARSQDCEMREGAAVCDVTSLISDYELPNGTRCIIRREPPHPGAERSLFSAIDHSLLGFPPTATATPSSSRPPSRPTPMSNGTSLAEGSGALALPLQELRWMDFWERGAPTARRHRTATQPPTDPAPTDRAATDGVGRRQGSGGAGAAPDPRSEAEGRTGRRGGALGGVEEMTRPSSERSRHFEVMPHLNMTTSKWHT